MDSLTRRRFVAVTTAAAASWPLSGIAAPRRIAFLAQIARPEPFETHIFGTLAAALRNLGYVEGRTASIDWSFANGDVAALPGLAASIVQAQPEVVITAGTLSVVTMHKATKEIPIIFGNVSDPVGAGVVKSLNSPGTNVTGVLNFSSPMMPKLLEVLLDAVPRVGEVGVLVNPLQPSHAGILDSLRPLAQARRVRVVGFPTATASDIESAFSAMARDNVRALVVPVEGLFIQHRKMIAELAIKSGVVLAAVDSEFADAGALVTYGADQHAMFRTVADYADRVLRGTRPQELPVQQPSAYIMAINRRTEKALQLQLPPSLLLRANRVIGDGPQ